MKQLREFAFLVNEHILSSPTDLKDVMYRLEREVIVNMMISCGDNQSEASRRLGISRTALRYKLAEYDKIKRIEADVYGELDDNGQRLDGN